MECSESKIVLITNTDMSRQSGDVTLILRRAKAIYENTGIKTICLLLKNKSNISGSEGISFKYISMDRKKIKTIIEEIKPSKVIFFGVGSYVFIPLVRRVVNKLKLHTELICDIQGVPEELIEFEFGVKKLMNFPRFILKKSLLKYGVKMSDGAFIVSTEMKYYIKEMIKRVGQGKFKFYKIRCGVSNLISTNQKKSWRSEIRSDLGLSEHTYIFAFSGYRMPWQNVDKILDIFQQYDKELEDIHFALFCNIDEEFSKQIEDRFPKKNYTLKFLKSEEYYKYLSACDVGFLLRDKNVTNRVAFPNKFSDYLNAGLTIAMNESLYEPFEILEKHDIEYINTNEIKNINSILQVIDKRKQNLENYYKLTEKVCHEELSYDKQIKKEKFLLQTNNSD